MKKLFGLAFVAALACATNSMAAKCADVNATYGPISFSEVSTGSTFNKTTKCIAVIDADGEHHNDAVVIPSTVTVDSVYYFRSNSSKNAIQTVVLPFAPTGGCKPETKGANLQTLNRINYNESEKIWKALVNPVTTSNEGFVAGKPYFVKFGEPNSEGKYYMALGGCTFELGQSSEPMSDSYANPPETLSGAENPLKGKWVFKGVYSKKTWDENDPERLVSYGFASKSANGATIGQFVKAGANASVPPLRAYLIYDSQNLLKAAAGAVSSIEPESLPTTIEVIEEDEDGNTLSIAQLNTRTGEIVADKDAWFDLKGRKLNKKPTVKGTYYNNGQKVIIK